MRFKSIRMRMLVLLCAMVILALGVTAYVGWSSSYDILFNASISGGQDAANLMLQEIETRLAEPSGEVSTLSSDELFTAWLIGRGANPLVLAHMQTILGRSAVVDRITLVDANGRSLDSTLGANAVVLEEEGQWYARAMSAPEGGVVYSEPYFYDELPAMSIAVPVFSGGRRVGACAVQIFLREDIFQNVRQFKYPKIEGASGYCWVVDREGLLISHPGAEKELTATLRNHSNPDLAQVIEDMIVGIGEEEPMDSRYIYEGVDKYVFWRVDPETGWGIAVTANVEDFFKPMAALNIKFGVVSFVIFVISVIMIIMIANGVTRPVRELVRVFNNMSAGNLDDKAAIKSVDEFRTLCDAQENIVTVLKNLHAEFSALAQFCEQEQFDKRGKTDQFQGAYKEIVLAANDMMKAVDGAVSAIKEAVGAVQEVIDDAKEGKLDARVELAAKGDMALLCDGVNDLMNAVTDPMSKVLAVMDEMAGGNLQISITENYKGDFDKLKSAINNTLDALNNVLLQVAQATEQVTSGSQQMSDTAQSLSQGASEQASSLEEVSSSISELESQTKQNAENAQQANALSSGSSKAAERGSSEMGGMLSAMKEINESSQNISKIIKVIDEIAFQTNLLALNAAVEAARAGVHGKGFAVVAEEVRNLAARSAQAAKETSDLIEGSVGKVNRGMELAENTAKALEEIVESVKKVTDLMGEIASASNEQAQGLGQINQGVGQMNSVTQQNAAGAEELASVSEELSSQAVHLKEMVGRFRVRGGEEMEEGMRTQKKKAPPQKRNEKPQAPPQAEWGSDPDPSEAINLDDDFGKF